MPEWHINIDKCARKPFTDAPASVYVARFAALQDCVLPMPRRLYLAAEIVRDVATTDSISVDREALIKLAESLEGESRRLLTENHLNPHLDAEMQRILPTIRHLAAVFCPESISPGRK